MMGVLFGLMEFDIPNRVVTASGLHSPDRCAVRKGVCICAGKYWIRAAVWKRRAALGRAAAGKAFSAAMYTLRQ